MAVEAWGNGQRAWLRVGKPYAVDVSRPVRAGKNHLCIVVTNSEDNKWAVWPWRDNLKNIRINDLMGPVRIVPYLDETMVGKKQ